MNRDNDKYFLRDRKALYGLTAGALLFFSGLSYAVLGEDIDKIKMVTPICVGAGLASIVLSCISLSNDRDRR